MKKVTSKWSVLALVVGVSMAWGCASSDGSPSDGQGAPTQQVGTGGPGESPSDSTPQSFSMIKGSVTAEGSGSIALGLAGKELVANVKSVRISALLEGGNLKTLAEVPVDLGGLYSAKLPVDAGFLIAQAVGITGTILGSSIIGNAGQTVSAIIAAPISTVSSIQAEVLKTLSGGGIPNVGNLATIATALVDAELGNAIALAAAAGADVKALIGAVSNAVAAAQTAILNSLGSAGGIIDTAVLTKLQTTALQTLNSALAQVGGATTAATQLVGTLKGALTGVTDAADSVVGNAIAAGTATFQAVLKTALANVNNITGVVWSAVHSATELQAQVVANTVKTVLGAAGASQAALGAVTKAADALVAQVAAATNIDALKLAKLDFLNAIVGGAQGPVNSVVGLLTNVTSTLTSALNSTVASLEALTKDLQATLTGILGDVTKLDLANLDATVKKVVDAVQKFASGVQGLVPNLDGVLSLVQAKALTDALGLVQGIVIL